LDTKKDILWRAYLGFILLAILSLCVFGKAVYIQTVKGDVLRELSAKRYTHVEEIEAERGTIFSEDGKMLCTSIPIYDIRIDFQADGLQAKNGELFTNNIDSLSICLANLFNDKTKEEYKQELKRGFKLKDRYYLLKRSISYEQYHALINFPLVRLGKNKSGFITEESTKRLNPYNMLAFRTIGLVKKDSSFNVGIERYYDSILKGTTGSRVVKTIAGNINIPVEGFDIEPEKGKDINTTLDVAVQDIAETALYKKLKQQDAEYGTCIVMEVKTGKIKAIANLGKMDNGSYWEKYNYALESYEPGSTMKLASILALLEDGYADLTTPVNLFGGVYKYNSTATMYDAEEHGKNESNLLNAFETSSNVGISLLVSKHYRNNPTKFINHYRRLNFDQTTGIDLIGERKPKIPIPGQGQWSGTSLPWMSVGYEMQINPLQVLCLYNAIANNGVYMKPYLVNSIKNYGATIDEHKPVIVNSAVCSPLTLTKIKTCLEGVVQHGTARVLKNVPYGIAGKTGTALVSGKGVTYQDNVYMSSFAGYFPANNPQYSCIVVIKNKPNAKDYTGAAVAVPVFKEIADRVYGLRVTNNALTNAHKKDSSLFSSYLLLNDAKALSVYLNIWVHDSTANTDIAQWQQGKGKTILAGRQTKPNTMPNVVGLGLRDAMYILETKGCIVSFSGQGKVALQTIAPGTTIVKGDKIKIELK
jgi:cell division protein FtsI (penicillin-binding protein 3)